MSIVYLHKEESKKHFLPQLEENVSEPVAPTAPIVDSYQVDVIGQLHANVAKVQELHGRLSFMMNEVSSLIKRR